MSVREGVIVLVWAASTCFPTAQPQAATPLVEIRVSPDTTVDLAGAIVDDEGIAADNLTGTVTPLSIGAIPAQADLDGYAMRSNGEQLLSFDTTVVLPGGLTAQPGDVVRFNGASYAIEFDAAARGVPSGANVDAVAIYGNLLLVSFDISVNLSGLQVDDEDLVTVGAVTFGMFFDGSAAGISPDLDLDAADYLDCADHLLLSFDGSGAIGGVAFDDEDVLEYDRATTWEVAYDGSAQHPSWVASDLDAVHAMVNLGPGPPVVFGQTVQAAADKVVYQWPSPVAFKAVRGSFITPGNIGTYTVDGSVSGTGTSLSEPSTPASGTGYWYLVKPGGCIQSSWQSTLGSEPGRDAAIP